MSGFLKTGFEHGYLRWVAGLIEINENDPTFKFQNDTLTLERLEQAKESGLDEEVVDKIKAYLVLRDL